jgi:hypothetical protein
MQNRYRQAADLPPSREFVEAYLREAQPTIGERLAEPEETEKLRVDAVSALRALARSAQANVDEFCNMTDGGISERGSRLGAIPWRLRQFLTIAGLRILTADDPAAALRRFLGQTPRGRGRPPADNAFRNLMIAADVQEMHIGGASIDAACCAVGKAAGLSPEAVRKIYFVGRDTDEVETELGMRELLGRGRFGVK